MKPLSILATPKWIVADLLCSDDGACSVNKIVYANVQVYLTRHHVHVDQVSRACCSDSREIFTCRPLGPTMDSIGCIGCAFSDRCNMSSGDDADAGLLLVCPVTQVPLTVSEPIVIAVP